MATLYELTGQWAVLMDMAETGECDEQTIADTLEGLEGEIEDKAVNYGKVIRSLESDVNAIAVEVNRLKDKSDRIQRNIHKLKDSLQEAMEITGKQKIKTDLFNFRIQKNPPRLVTDDKSKIPQEFFISQEPKLDGKAALQYVKENGPQDWGHAEQGESLRIM